MKLVNKKTKTNMQIFKIIYQVIHRIVFQMIISMNLKKVNNLMKINNNYKKFQKINNNTILNMNKM